MNTDLKYLNKSWRLFKYSLLVVMAHRDVFSVERSSRGDDATVLVDVEVLSLLGLWRGALERVVDDTELSQLRVDGAHSTDHAAARLVLGRHKRVRPHDKPRDDVVNVGDDNRHIRRGRQRRRAVVAGFHLYKPQWDEES